MKVVVVFSSIALLCAVASSALARNATSVEILKCANEGEAKARLLCYDELFRGDSNPSYTNEAKWQVTENTDPINDTMTILAARSSVDGKYALVFRCKRRELGAFVTRNTLWGNGSRVSVTMRVDKELPVTSAWNIAGDGRTAIAASPMSFTKWALAASRLAIRFESSGIEDTAVFELGDTSSIESKLKAACQAEFL